MTDGETQEFVRAPWRLRAIAQTNVENADDGGTEDMVFWFAAREGQDQWFAYGLSSMFHQAIADDLFDHLPEAITTVMLALAGQPWNIIAAMPTQHAQSQRDVLHEAQQSGRIDELMLMSEDDIRQLRSEVEYPGPGMN